MCYQAIFAVYAGGKFVKNVTHEFMANNDSHAVGLVSKGGDSYVLIKFNSGATDPTIKLLHLFRLEPVSAEA